MAFLHSGSDRQQCRLALADRKKRQKFALYATLSADSFGRLENTDLDDDMDTKRVTKKTDKVQLFTLSQLSSSSSAPTSTESILSSSNRGVQSRPVYTRDEDQKLAFNSNSHFAELCFRLINDHVIDVVVETGTFRGASTAWFSHIVPEVHSIEINPTYYSQTSRLLENYVNCVFHLGNSSEILPRLLPQMNDKRILFYLDAHWGDYWPIRDELKCIAMSHAKNNCIVIVDDFQIPNRPDVPYDSYKKQPLNLDFIKKELAQVFPDLHYEYYIPPKHLLQSRGRLIAFPLSWYWNSHQKIKPSPTVSPEINPLLDPKNPLSTPKRLPPPPVKITPSSTKSNLNKQTLPNTTNSTITTTNIEQTEQNTSPEDRYL